jgi:hypothetical protein
MTERDETPQQHGAETAGGRRIDDRRREVKPTDHPVPSSPEAEHEAVREGEEKLGRVKPY